MSNQKAQSILPKGALEKLAKDEMVLGGSAQYLNPKRKLLKAKAAAKPTFLQKIFGK